MESNEEVGQVPVDDYPEMNSPDATDSPEMDPPDTDSTETGQECEEGAIVPQHAATLDSSQSQSGESQQEAGISQGQNHSGPCQSNSNIVQCGDIQFLVHLQKFIENNLSSE
ncbi:hypothetical protein V6N11_021944 [Hibiscus sabdariffa]|uniref:Uncharacterized protein n=1 Tax=Hibiscus sabdariffa TaxID=183260 RepID=A0ABR2TI29_9ROSI